MFSSKSLVALALLGLRVSALRPAYSVTIKSIEESIVPLPTEPLNQIAPAETLAAEAAMIAEEHSPAIGHAVEAEMGQVRGTGLPSVSVAAAVETSSEHLSVASIAAALPSTVSGHAAVSTAAAAPMAHESAPAQVAESPSAGFNITTHVVKVGGAGGALTFSPENVKAQVSDLVQFQFHPKNHSVVQSTFEEPCVPLGNGQSTNSSKAFFSGFMPVSAAANGILTYTIRVNDAKPIWFYCSQAKHCQGGMVGAINAPETGEKTMAKFKELAAQAPENITPGHSVGTTVSTASEPGLPAGNTTVSGGNSGLSGSNSTVSSPPPRAPTPSSASSPAEQTINAAPGIQANARQSLFGLAICGIVAMLM